MDVNGVFTTATMLVLLACVYGDKPTLDQIEENSKACYEKANHFYCIHNHKCCARLNQMCREHQADCITVPIFPPGYTLAQRKEACCNWQTHPKEAPFGRIVACVYLFSNQTLNTTFCQGPVEQPGSAKPKSNSPVAAETPMGGSSGSKKSNDINATMIVIIAIVVAGVVCVAIVAMILIVRALKKNNHYRPCVETPDSHQDYRTGMSPKPGHRKLDFETVIDLEQVVVEPPQPDADAKKKDTQPPKIETTASIEPATGEIMTNQQSSQQSTQGGEELSTELGPTAAPQNDNATEGLQVTERPEEHITGEHADETTSTQNRIAGPEAGEHTNQATSAQNRNVESETSEHADRTTSHHNTPGNQGHGPDTTGGQPVAHGSRKQPSEDDEPSEDEDNITAETPLISRQNEIVRSKTGEHSDQATSAQNGLVGSEAGEHTDQTTSARNGLVGSEAGEHTDQTTSGQNGVVGCKTGEHTDQATSAQNGSARSETGEHTDQTTSAQNGIVESEAGEHTDQATSCHHKPDTQEHGGADTTGGQVAAHGSRKQPPEDDEPTKDEDNAIPKTRTKSPAVKCKPESETETESASSDMSTSAGLE